MQKGASPITDGAPILITRFVLLLPRKWLTTLVEPCGAHGGRFENRPYSRHTEQTVFAGFLSNSMHTYNIYIRARQIAIATRLARILGAISNAPWLLVQNLFLAVHDVNAFAGISHAAAGNVIDSRLFRLPKRRACYARGNLFFLFRQSKQVLATRI